MRVVLLVGRSTGGIGVQAVDLATELRSLGDEVELVTDALTAQRFGIARARLWWPGRSAGLLGSWRGLRRMRRLAAGADVVHAHGHQAGLVGCLVTAGLSTPLVVSQHNAILAVGGPQRLAGTVVEGLVARRATLTTGASSDLVERARTRGARTARLAPVPSPRVPGLLSAHPLDEAARAAAAATLEAQVGIEPTGPLVVTISRIAPQKSLDVLVAAAARIASRVTWVVIGDGEPRLLAALRDQVRREEAPVHFVGALADPSTWLSAAEVFVLPSVWEARALVVQEAMAAGTPVVASDTGGLRDLVGGAGLLVPVGDPDRLAEAVLAVIDDGTRRDALSRQGRDVAASWDDGRATARRWHEWYSALPSMT